eukprot:11193302-Lingulodinium_polyedra.AAC.1
MAGPQLPRRQVGTTPPAPVTAPAMALRPTMEGDVLGRPAYATGACQASGPPVLRVPLCPPRT